MVRLFFNLLTLAALLWGSDAALRRSGHSDQASQRGAAANAQEGNLQVTAYNDPVSPDEGEDSVTPQAQLHRAVQSLDVVGNNGSPAWAYPLGLCQGDCDNDNDCEGELVCLKRSAGDGDVPGCQGSDSKGIDYCVYPQGQNDDAEDDYDQGQDASDSGNNDNNANAQSSYIDPAGDSLFKMHWEPYYFWQEESIERKWCMQCHGNDPGSRARIVNCDSGDATRLIFERQSSSNDFRIRVSGGDLCLARPVTNMDYSLFQRCDDGDEQLWMTNQGDAFGSGDFQISPKTQPGDCLTITHHPKADELLWVSTCQYTEDNDTSLWERYEINS